MRRRGKPPEEGNMRTSRGHRGLQRSDHRLHRVLRGAAHLGGIAAILLTGWAGTSVAVASGAEPTGIIQGCLNIHNGRLRVVEGDTVCRRNEELISWNQQGPAGAPGPAGSAGASGVSGPAFHTESRTPVTVPTSFTSLLGLNLPAGSYAVTATILLNNLGFSRVPVLCVLAGPIDSSVIS